MKVKEYEYNLTFPEVPIQLFNSYETMWFQGENFVDGVIITVQNGILRCIDFSENGHMWEVVVSTGICTQKYRRVYTQKDVMREG